jgi:hypothetical protein
MASRMADIVALRAERLLARWTRNAFLWRYPVCAILVEAVFFLSIYVLNHGTGGESWFALVLMLLLLQVLLVAIFLGITGLGLLRRHFKLALAAFLGAGIIAVAPWSSARIGPALQEAIDRARFYAVRASYDAIIAKMPPEERSSRVMFFDWGESGFAGSNAFHWVVYDESGEILLSDPERTAGWKEQAYPQNRILHSSNCRTAAFQLDGHFYSVSTYC